jgi:hypothetical protein
MKWASRGVTIAVIPDAVILQPPKKDRKGIMEREKRIKGSVAAGVFGR